MKLRATLALLSLLVLFATPVDHAYAGLWKRRKHHNAVTSGTGADSVAAVLPWHQDDSRKTKRRQRRETEKEQKRARRQERKQHSDASGNDHSRKRDRKYKITYPPTTIKGRYRIDVLASVYLGELTKMHGPRGAMQIPDKAIPGLGIYEGARLAADSLKRAGVAVDIVIHDITARHESVDSLIKRGVLDSSDLVIGAVAPGELPRLATLCQKRKVNLVSVLSPADGGVHNNRFFTMVQPSLRAHCDYLAAYLRDHFGGRRILWLYRTHNAGEDNATHYFRDDSGADLRLKGVNCDHLPTRKDLLPWIDTLHPQPILISVLDVVYADSLLRLLGREFPLATFEIIGMPSWSGLNLGHRSATYPNISFRITAPYNFDAGAPAAHALEHAYKKEFPGTPGEFVYRGFEIVLQYARLTAAYGTVFNEHYAELSDGLFTHYNIVPRYDAAGQLLYHENRNIYLLHYVRKD